MISCLDPVELEKARSRLFQYCRGEGWAGYDPYDGLNSPIAGLLPGKAARIAFTQFMRRSPLNFRPLFGIKKELNAKGLALSARAILLLWERMGWNDTPGPGSPGGDESSAAGRDFRFIMGSLLALRSPAYTEACWGYNFPWQSRAFFIPRGVPNVVCTVFAAHAYLDWYDRTEVEHRLELAASSCRFVLDYLNRTTDGKTHCFSYTPLDQTAVHNVNMMAAELLARVYSKVKNEEFREAAEAAVRYTVARQRKDGSWPYGESRSQQWVDSFHTGFILTSLKRTIGYLELDGFTANLEEAHRFYLKKFFLADGRPKYYHNRVFPIDVHSAAVAIIALVETSDLSPEALGMADKVMRWTLANLQDPKGYFRYQKHWTYSIKIPYARWAQAWMLYAISVYTSRLDSTR